MRNPAFGAPAAALYQASIEQCAWADKLGFETVYLAEHHGADDGYGPAPMIQAAALMAVTRTLKVHFSALLAPLHEPLRLAEDLAILDLISQGRVEVTLGLGYRPHEYRMFGVAQPRLLEHQLRDEEPEPLAPRLPPIDSELLMGGRDQVPARASGQVARDRRLEVDGGGHWGKLSRRLKTSHFWVRSHECSAG